MILIKRQRLLDWLNNLNYLSPDNRMSYDNILISAWAQRDKNLVFLEMIELNKVMKEYPNAGYSDFDLFLSVHGKTFKDGRDDGNELVYVYIINRTWNS
jgi:hypothetical protein